jgi:translocation and assembly module TamB
MKRHTLVLRSVLVLAVLAAIAALALYWASRSEAVLRWGVAYAAERLPGKLVVEGLSGSLSAPVSIARLQYSAEGVDVEARGVALLWSPWLLALGDRLSIDRLHVEQLRVSARSTSTQPTSLPAHLRLPLSVYVGRLEVGKLELQSGASTVALNDIVLFYEGGARFHHLRVDRVGSRWGSGKGELELAAQSPFAVTGTIDFNSAAQPDWPCVVHAKLGGNLQSVDISLEAQVRELAIQADARMAPFDAVPLQFIAARTAGVDLARFVAGAPVTVLDVTFQGRATESDRIEGQIAVTNRRAGTLDKDHIPVQALSGRLSVDPRAVRLSDAVVDLGSAGRATGQASVERGTVTAELYTTDLDLRGIHGALRSTRLSGSASVTASADAQDYAVDLSQDRLRLVARGRREADTLLVRSLDLRSGSALLQASGRFGLAAPNAFSAAGELKRFDPSAFGDFPAASVNAAFETTGRLRPEWEVALHYRLQPSTLRRQALSGQGTLKISPVRLGDVDAQLALAGNRLRLKGAFGRPGDTLELELDAPHLKRVDLRFAGSARASGRITGTRERPGADLALTANGLSLPGGYGAAALDARVTLQQSEDPAFDVQVHGRGLAHGKTQLQSATLKAGGSFSRHRVELRAGTEDLDLAVLLEGAWHQSAREWSGRITSLENRGAFAFKLAGPAPLEVGEQRFAFGPGSMELPDGKVTIGETRYGNGELASTGTFTGFPAARLLRFAQAPSAIQTSVKLGGRWSLSAAGHVNGRIEIQRESGDLTVALEEEHIALGVHKLAANVDVVNDEITGNLAVAAEHVGEATARVETRLEQRGGNWGIPGRAPFVLAGRAELASLKPVTALFTRAVAVNGALTLDVAGTGTVAEPELSGRADATGLSIEQVDNGVFLREGSLHAEFSGRTLELKQLTIRGGEGTFGAKGRVVSENERLAADLEWTANNLAAVQRPDLLLVVSGNGTAALDDELITLRGKLKADRGRVELRSGTAPALGDDVIVVGRKSQPIGAQITRHDLELEIDLGPDFEIHGRGLDARLEGKLLLRSAPGAPLTATGEISVARGTFAAFSRKLHIEEGKLIFTGPIDNPGLHIRAMRKNQQVEAGVEVSGTARAPRVVLVSSPEVPAADKLSWLVLGRAADTGNLSDRQQLQSSAAILMANMGTSSLQTQVAQAVGLDEVSFAPADTAGEGGMVLLAKRISDRIYVIFEQSLSTATSTVKVNYQLSRRWSLRTESGEIDAVDLFYSFSFD